MVRVGSPSHLRELLNQPTLVHSRPKHRKLTVSEAKSVVEITRTPVVVPTTLKLCSVVSFCATQAGEFVQAVAKVTTQVVTLPDPTVIFEALSVPTTLGLVPQEVMVGAVPENC